MATVDQLKSALIQAHNAGDTEAAQMFADKIKAMQAQPEQPKYNVTDGMSTTQLVGAGMGKAVVDLGRGFDQLANQADLAVNNQADTGSQYNPLTWAAKAYKAGNEALGVDPQAEQARLQEEEKAARARDAALMETGAGKVGNVVGAALATAPMAMVAAPGYVGAAVSGGVQGALQPTIEGESKLKNAAIGAGLGAAGQAVGQGVAKVAEKITVSAAAKQAAKQAANAERDATLQAAQQAGYVVTPGMANTSTTGKLLNGLSGKAKTEQLARVKNQQITDKLARKALGLDADVPITPDVTKAVRAAAYDTGYAPVAQLGNIEVDKAFQGQLNSIVSKYSGASKSFPGAAKNTVADIAEGYKVPNFDAGDAVQQIQFLRDSAGDAFAKGDALAGKAQREIAKALEDQIERSLTKQGENGAELLTNFRDARKLMAKAHTVEQALQVGSGSVDASKLAAALRKGKPLDGDLATAGKFANVYKEAARMPGPADANPLSVLDYFGGATGAGMASMTGGASIPLMLLPAARVGARYGVLSKAGQKAFTQPSYDTGALNKLLSLGNTEAAKRIAQLTPASIYFSQQ